MGCRLQVTGYRLQLPSLEWNLEEGEGQIPVSRFRRGRLQKERGEEEQITGFSLQRPSERERELGRESRLQRGLRGLMKLQFAVIKA